MHCLRVLERGQLIGIHENTSIYRLDLLDIAALTVGSDSLLSVDDPIRGEHCTVRCPMPGWWSF
jgi:hypothetical protein